MRRLTPARFFATLSALAALVVAAAGFGLVALLADLLVQVNRNRETVLPAASFDSDDL